MSKVWYITGASKGLGLALVKHLLEQGHKVAATSRKPEELTAAVSENSHKTNLLSLHADLTSEQSIADSLSAAHRHFGRLDIIVNNAGYGIGGAIEELSTRELMDSFTINFLATTQVIKHAMPFLRTQRSGHIINISSIAGWAGTMGWAAYAASKAAVIALTEGLAQDVNELGIKATVICPGAFRTEFLTKESLIIAARNIEDYAGIHANHQKYHAMDQQQAGDPAKAARLMLELAEHPEPPTVLFIGSDAYKRASLKLEQHRENLEKYKEWSSSTDY